MKKIFRVSILVVLVCFIPAACAGGYVAMELFNGDYSKLSKAKIFDILSKETILYYSDGESQLGSLFGQEHRIYVPIDRIPRVMKNAIVSAEDEDFYTNIGINLKGIVRAAVHNLLFHSRQGASTITQQTVKNLYGRKETDLFTKFKETVTAFKLEKMYSKDQILEFYLNQFHVTGNGRGVGVAAKYYFNKDIEDLNLIESAFIAGSVKGPEKYNPFTKITPTGQQKARHEALIRKNYVLERMFKNKKISQVEFQAALKEAVPFNQGKFQYNELSVNQIVIKQLSRPEVLQAIGVNNVDEIGTMGLHITTTIDQKIQNATQYGLRQNLSRMQVILKGFSPEPQSNFVNIQNPELHSFYVARVANINATPNQESVTLSFGVPSCLVDTDGVNRISINTDQIVRKGLQKSKSNFLKSIAVGQYVLASVKKIDQTGAFTCDIESRPKVQGASIVLDKSKIVAMAGGFSSNEYNRALYAQRQPGSTFKLPTYYAALQMGWSVLDSLSNARDVFTWQGHFYYPRPDHIPNSIETTILGAGAKSENLASIWLLSHLLDKLNYNQFQDLLKFLGIVKEGESKQQSLGLIANKFNATPDNITYIKEGILNKIKNDAASDLSMINNNSLKLFIRTLHYGTDFDKERDSLTRDRSLNEKEKGIRLNIVNNNLMRWNALALRARAALTALSKLSQGSDSLSELDKEVLSSFAKLDDKNDELAFVSPTPWQPDISTYLIKKTQWSALDSQSLILMAKNSPGMLNANNILLDGVVPLSLIESIDQNVQTTLADVLKKDPLERLFWNADFKYSLSMYYTANMVNSMGISEPLQWVPSFPLGSNVVTLANLALMYQTFLNGKLYRFFDIPRANQLLVIKRVEDANGNLVWEAKGKEVPFVDSFFSAPILNTLRGTVTGGTAYTLNWSTILRSDNDNLDKKLILDKIRVPVFGKTGTTNNYTNGTYIGFLPYPAYKGDTLTPDNAYTIASYIGYDSNEPMVHNWYKAYGGVAIPAWQEIALDIIKSQNFADKLNYEDLEKNKNHMVSFKFGDDLSHVVVPFNSGVSLSAQDPDDDGDSNSTDLYANDYSNNGKKTFQLWLDGSSSDNVFVPKRKISFYTPYVYEKPAVPLKQNALEPTTPHKDGVPGPAGAAGVAPLPIAPQALPESNDDEMDDAPAQPISSTLKEDSANEKEESSDIPPPPPGLK